MNKEPLVWRILLVFQRGILWRILVYINKNSYVLRIYIEAVEFRR